MAKQINFSYEGRDYCLEFTRKTVQEMERDGFEVSDVQTKPMSAVLTLFAGAFRANHRGTKRELIEKIYQDMPDKEKLIEKLAEMYNEPIQTLLEEPEEGSAKKVSWTASW